MIIGLILLQFLSGVFSDSLVISRSDDLEYISVFPRFVETDEHGNIYVAEMAEFAIRKYDADGNFLKRIGRRGRGPGEFQDITSFSYHDGKLLIIDYLSGRLSQFTTEGEVLHETLIDQRAIPWPRQIVFYEDRVYVLSASSDSESIIKLLDTDFKLEKEILLKTTIYGNDAIALDYMPLHPGSLLITQGRFLFAPYFYSGKLFSWDSLTDEIKIIQGLPISGASYEVLPNNASSYSIRYGGSFGLTNLKLNHESRGLFSYKNTILHFIQYTDGGRKVFGYEVYNTDFELIQFIPLIEKSIPTREAVDIPISVKAIDSQGRIIFHNYDSASLVAYNLYLNLEKH